MTVPLLEKPAVARIPWAALAWFALLLGILYAPVIGPMVREWSEDDSMGHGFFVPVVAGYIAWQRREVWLKAPVEGHWFGWVIVLWGFAQLIAGYLGADFFIMRTALLMSLFGVLLALVGWPMMKELAFPLFLLLFMIRIPLFIYSQITFPLQLFASSVAAETLMLVGIPVYQDGNILELADQKLQVVEACSGIRSLLSLSFLSLVYGYFFDNKPWMKWVLLVMSVPIAIAANALRVSLTGIISAYKKELAEGLYHSFEGWVIFMVALVALVLVHTVLNRGLRLLRKGEASHA